MLESMEMYQMLLSDLTDEQVLQAVTVYLRKQDSFYWPTPGQLRACIQQPVSTRYEQAWAACMDAASKRLGTPAHPGCNREPVRRYINDDEWVEFPAPEYKWEVDEATWRGIQACGGWQVFKKMDLSHIASQRVAFRGAYEGAVETIHRQLENKTAACIDWYSTNAKDGRLVLFVVPIKRDQAKKFVAQWHRHLQAKFRCSVFTCVLHCRRCHSCRGHDWASSC